MEIQFKVYEEEKKKYHINPRIYGNNGLVEIDSFYPSRKVTVLAYTGLRDRYGAKIYEHDIVYDEDEEDLGEVLWDNDEARWIVVYDGAVGLLLGLGDGYNTCIEVIANYPKTIEECKKENESVEDDR